MYGIRCLIIQYSNRYLLWRYRITTASLKQNYDWSKGSWRTKSLNDICFLNILCVDINLFE